MKELSKSIARRLSDSNFIRKYFIGEGIDIGGKPDPLSLYQELFPQIRNIRIWDIEDGDAQYMESVPDETVDFVHSSHCLEHLLAPEVGLKNWIRILKPNGHLIVTVPDEDLYEQGIFPSAFNFDHKWTFTIYKEKSWSAKSINIVDLLKTFGAELEIVKLELLTSTYRYRLPRYDQTLTPIGECGIEIIARKRTHNEYDAGGLATEAAQPSIRERVHYNQYRDDLRTLKQSNENTPPFENSEEL